MHSARSKNGVLIRLPDERWVHITEEHSELAGNLYNVLETIAEPSVIYSGSLGEMLAVSEIETGKYLVAVYKEIDSNDGFLITAFFTRRLRQLEKRRRLWPS